MATWTDRILAAIFPLLTYVIWLLISYPAFLIPVIVYLVINRVKRPFVAGYLLRYIDTLLTVIVFSFIFFMSDFSLGIASKDAGIFIPFISDGGLLTVGLLILQGYALISGILFTVFPFFGAGFQMPVSLRILESLRGKPVCQVTEKQSG